MEGIGKEKRCNFWLAKKKRFCANSPLSDSLFCGNHKPGSEEVRVPCPIDPSHSILQENLDAHVKRCPMQKQVRALQMQPFFKKGVNCGKDDEVEGLSSKSTEAKISCSGPYSESSEITSEMKRNAIYQMSKPEFSGLLKKIQSIHISICSNIQDSYAIPEACDRWLKNQGDRQLPFQEKHVLQQASILGNLEAFGIIGNSHDFDDQEADEHLCCDDSSRGKIETPPVIEFGAGRGYLTQMLADCYGIQKVFLVERRSYKLKADRSLRQKQQMILERLRIDIEDLNLDAIESLRGVPYLAIGKHLCGPATDLTLRCCLPKRCSEDGVLSSSNCNLKGLALATCCHHLCQWKHYINKRFFSDLGISKEDFHAITWFTSWAVDADHGSILSDVVNHGLHKHNMDPSLSCENRDSDVGVTGVEEIVRNMKAVDRAVLGLICKEIIDIGRLMWVKEHGLEAQLVKYVPSNISPENHLLVAKETNSI
ncbi:tRNA:m4X modification enzyme TRM13 [Cinnamomum micranthum f. kanehirae]|uniref:tRNA:m(4)X modification enzyme TRM13 n=1 Tax=Cinnamomum micranthum f. kanehirae TaxID=337451 RepID=A0A3S3N285_9MAGN|nr:tRNA:m4X modification enzyme TRM13 [Cinnamomum micranthum f. kanehirae]